MKNLKNVLRAFTLAEILITLTIVGVVARLTLPALTQNVLEQQTAATFAKAINTLENVNQKILLDKNSKTLSSACSSFRGYGSCLNNYLNGTYKSTRISNTLKLSHSTLTTKDGINYIFPAAILLPPDVQNPNRPAKYYGSTYQIIIDTNGTKGPNKIGKDRFRIYVDYYGQVIPHGGAQYAEYSNSNTILWNTGCPSRKTVKPTNAESCSGSIADNGYKILYGFNAL